MQNVADLTVANGIAHLELVNEKSRNALDRAMVDAIAAAVDNIENQVKTNSGLRALVISARGPAFCVGGDLTHFVSRMDSLAEEFDYMISRWHRSLAQLAALPIAVVAAIHGGAAGGGLGLAWVADHIVAADNTRIATGFADLGVSGDGGNSWYLPRAIGMRRARELLLENRILDAATALDWGLVNQVTPVEQLKDAAFAKARQLAEKSPRAIAAMKTMLAASLDNSYQQQLAVELQNMLASANSGDAKTGMTAFLNKQKPQF